MVLLVSTNYAEVFSSDLGDLKLHTNMNKFYGKRRADRHIQYISPPRSMRVAILHLKVSGFREGRRREERREARANSF